MRALITVTTVLFAGGMGCANVLGISDPVAASDAHPGGEGGPHDLVSIAISPDPLDLPVGIVKPLAVIGMYTDSSTDDLTAQATWVVDSGSVTVDSVGVVTAIAQGPARITATVGVFTDSVDATVGPAAPDHISISVGNFTIAQQQRAQLHAQIVFTDKTVQDGTASVTWSSDDPSVATVAAGQVDALTQSGTATITAGVAGVPPASVLATVSVLACHPVINETQAGGGGGASDEWCEIYNPCTVAIDVTSWTLVYRAASAVGTTDTNGLITLSGSMAPGELRLFSGNGFTGTSDGIWGGGVMQQTNGAMGLRSGPKDTGPLVDSVAYGAVGGGHPFVEGTTAPALANGSSISRAPFDGNDTNDGTTNFVLTTLPTPRALNAP